MDGGLAATLAIAILGSSSLGAVVTTLISRRKPKDDRLTAALDRADKELAKAASLVEVYRQLDDEHELYEQILRHHVYKGDPPPPPDAQAEIKTLKKMILNITLGREEP